MVICRTVIYGKAMTLKLGMTVERLIMHGVYAPARFDDPDLENVCKARPLFFNYYLFKNCVWLYIGFYLLDLFMDG